MFSQPKMALINALAMDAVPSPKTRPLATMTMSLLWLFQSLMGALFPKVESLFASTGTSAQHIICNIQVGHFSRHDLSLSMKDQVAAEA